MARKTNKQKAQELVEEVDRLFSKARTLRERMTSAESILPKMDEAIKLDPKNASAWSRRGVANRRLGKYDNAIKDFDEALRLDPKDTSTQRSRQGAEIAKLRGRSARAVHKRRTESTKQLNKEFEILGDNLRWYQKERFALFAFLFGTIVLYFFFVIDWSCLWDKSCFAIDTSNASALLEYLLNAFLANLSRFSILSFIVFPIVWIIRLHNEQINRTEILKWDIFSRDNVANSIEYYQDELDDKRNDIIIAYMVDWINNNPADKLLTLQRKKPTPTEKSEHEMPQQEVKNLLEQLAKRDTKGGLIHGKKNQQTKSPRTR